MEGNSLFKDIDSFVQLLKRGDRSSLSELRKALGRTQEELSILLGVSQGTLNKWEEGEEQPSSHHHIVWKLKLSDLIDERISGYLNTGDKEVVNHFWEIMWRLHN